MFLKSPMTALGFTFSTSIIGFLDMVVVLKILFTPTLLEVSYLKAFSSIPKSSSADLDTKAHILGFSKRPFLPGMVDPV